jgi:hypothetical protein
MDRGPALSGLAVSWFQPVLNRMNRGWFSLLLLPLSRQRNNDTLCMLLRCYWLHPLLILCSSFAHPPLILYAPFIYPPSPSIRPMSPVHPPQATNRSRRGKTDRKEAVQRQYRGRAEAEQRLSRGGRGRGIGVILDLSSINPPCIIYSSLYSSFIHPLFQPELHPFSMPIHCSSAVHLLCICCLFNASLSLRCLHFLSLPASIHLFIL